MKNENEPKRAGKLLPDGFSLDRLEAMISQAPEDRPEGVRPPKVTPTLPPDFPARYRGPWDRPGGEWLERFTKARAVMRTQGILALCGPRGTGKTRLAAEIARDVASKGTRYLTALDFFVEIKATFGREAKRTELDVLTEFKRRRLLILDEIQERSENDWENRLLTNLIDSRYSNLKPTILIANLKSEELIESLGTSIVDRIREGGGLITVDGASFRSSQSSKP